MSLLAAVQAPDIDYKALSPLLAVLGGSVVVLMVGLFSSRYVRHVIVPLLTVASLVTAIGLTVWIWEPGDTRPIIEGALAVDALSLGISALVFIAGIATVLLSLRARAVQEAGHGEYFALLLGSIAGHGRARQAESLITLFVGLELLSIPLYALCATELRRKASLEAGLKYLVVGSVGSATLLYGLALIYGATGAMDFSAIAAALGEERRASPTRCCSPASRSPPPASPSRPRWRPSTSGRRTSTRAPPPRSPRSWPWPPRPRRSR